MNLLNLDNIIYNFPDNWRNPHWDETIKNNIKTIINSHLDKNINYEKIVTHNPQGEYGHYHHRTISKIVRDLLYNRNEQDKLYYFSFDKNKYVELPNIYNECINIYFEKEKQHNIKPLIGMKELSKISCITKEKII